MRIYYCPQRSKQWYDLRCGKLTASNFHCMLGNSWTTHSYLLEKAMERLKGKCVAHRFWTEDLQRGIDLEPEACRAYEAATGYNVAHVGFVELNDYIGSSPDGLVSSDGMVEFKCPNEKNFWHIDKTKHIAPAHFTQMQFNMWVCGRKWCDYVVYQSAEDPIIIRTNRDDEYIKMIAARAMVVNEMIDRYCKKLYYTVSAKSLKFKKVGVMSGFRLSAIY